MNIINLEEFNKKLELKACNCSDELLTKTLLTIVNYQFGKSTKNMEDLKLHAAEICKINQYNTENITVLYQENQYLFSYLIVADYNIDELLDLCCKIAKMKAFV